MYRAYLKGNLDTQSWADSSRSVESNSMGRDTALFGVEQEGKILDQVEDDSFFSWSPARYPSGVVFRMYRGGKMRRQMPIVLLLGPGELSRDQLHEIIHEAPFERVRLPLPATSGKMLAAIPVGADLLAVGISASAENSVISEARKFAASLGGKFFLI